LGDDFGSEIGGVMQKCGKRKSREIKEVKLPMRNEMETTWLKMRSNLDSIRTETGEVLKSMLFNLSALSFYPPDILSRASRKQRQNPRKS
jgi:hypothetical protein